MVKAVLEVLKDQQGSTEAKGGEQYTVTAQFNPQTLQITYNSTGKDPSNGTDKKAQASKAPDQQTGTLAQVSFDLLFDTTKNGSDVRQTTLTLASFMRPDTSGGQPAPRVPRVRF